MMDTEAYKPGRVILMGSGEPFSYSGTVFEESARLSPKPVRIAILETPAGFELNPDRVAGRVEEYLQNRLQNYRPIINIVPARKKGTTFSPDDIEILTPLH